MYITVNVYQSLTNTVIVGNMSAYIRAFSQKSEKCGKIFFKINKIACFMWTTLFDKLTFVVVSYSDPRMVISLFWK